MATHTHPDMWTDTDPAVIVTVLDVLEQQSRRGRRG